MSFKIKPPKGTLGYTQKELNAICKKYKISKSKFNVAFGINTCMLAPDGTPRYYTCDVERALHICGVKGIPVYMWD